jgi:hypothetical protein
MAHEKSPLKSKKFIAYSVSDFSWTLILFYMAWILHQGIRNTENGELNASLASLTSLMMAIIIVNGFVQVGYIVGQAALDKYVRVAQIASGRDPVDSNDASATVDGDGG